MAEEPDKGRSWLVAIAALIINLVMAGIFRAQGLLFVEFINVYGVTRKVASLPFSVRAAIRHLLAPIVGIIGQKYGARTVIIIGGILGTLSSASCFFASDITWIIIIWGVINGFAGALITVLPQVVISQYFVKHRTTATGISFSGGSIGSLVFPAIFELILNTYGLNGTFFILAGMVMHTIPAAMILKSPPWLKDDKHQNTSSADAQRSNGILRENKMYRKSSNIVKCECGVQVGNDRIHDILREKKVLRDAECKQHTLPRPRSHSYNGLTHQIHLNYSQNSSMFPTHSSIGMNYKTLSSKPENVFDVNMDYLKRHSDLVFHMLSMEIPNVEISYRAILLEVEQDDLWHPDQSEIIQEIEKIYFHIEKSLEVDQISSKTASEPSGLYLKRTLLSGTLTISKKSESLRPVKRYLKTYKERGLQQLGKIRSAPNMSNIYNEIARKVYVISKMKQLCNSNEIRVISHLCQYNPKDVLKVLFQVRNLYKMYNELESCDQCDSNELFSAASPVETGDISSHRKDSSAKVEQTPSAVNPSEHSNGFKVHIKAALNLHKKAIFLLICCTRAAFFVSFNPMVTTIVDFAMDRGLQEEDGKFIIVVMSVGDIVGRSCLGWITDRGYISLPRYMLFGMVFLSACLASIPQMYSRWTILSSVAVVGMVQGSLYIRHPVLVAKYLKPNEQSIAIGCMDFASGIICLLIPLYIGFFRDTVGSYNQIYYINGIIVFLSGIIWFFESRMVRADDLPDKCLPMKY